MKKVTFITKEGGCSLCDDAFVEIEGAQEYAEFELDILKIGAGNEYYAKYWDKIPVVLIDGKVAFTLRLTRDALIRKIKKRSWF